MFRFKVLSSKMKAMSRSTLSMVLVLCLLAVMIPTGIGILSVSASNAGERTSEVLGEVGTSIRSKGGLQGIRFKFSIKKDALNDDQLQEVGILVAKLSDNSADGINDALANENLYAHNLDVNEPGYYKYVSAVAYNSTDKSMTALIADDATNTYLFTAALVNFSTRAKYETQYIARAYAKYTDADGQESIVYSESIGNRYHNSVRELADHFYENRQDYSLTESELEFMTDVRNVCTNTDTDTLNNTYYQLKTKNELKVAYFGGSVTAGFGSTNSELKSWRALTTKWLREQYPSVTIKETNAAIGGTGTIYGAHRVVQDLKLNSDTEKPDLVFIDFSANDIYDANVNSTPGAYMESIIKTIYQYSPQTDIIMVFITDFDSKDKDYATKMAHKKVADAYQIPFIDVGARIWRDIVKEKGSVPADSSDTTWKKYFKDIVHATDAGYAKYAQYVREYLSDVLSEKTTVPNNLENAYIPATTLNTLPIAPYVDNLEGLEFPNGITFDRNANNGYDMGISFTFKFTGTDLMFWLYGDDALPSIGTLQVEVDGSSQSIGFKATNHKIIPIAKGLDNKEHTVKVTFMPTTDGVLKLNQFRNILIRGDSQMRGITTSGVVMSEIFIDAGDLE